MLRKEFEARRPAGVPSEPPTHAALVAAGPESAHRQVVPESALLAGQTESAGAR